MLNFFSRRERKEEIMKLLRVSLRVSAQGSTQLCHFPSFKSFNEFESYANRNPNFLVELYGKGTVLSLGELGEVLRSYLRGDFRDPSRFRTPTIFKTIKEMAPLSFDQAVTSYHLMLLLTSELGLYEKDINVEDEESLINDLLNFIVESYPDLALDRLASNYYQSECYCHELEGCQDENPDTGVILLPSNPMGGIFPGLDSSIFRELTKQNNLLDANSSLAAFSTNDLPFSIFSKYAKVFVGTQDAESAAKVIAMVALNEVNAELELQPQLFPNPSVWNYRQDLDLYLRSLNKGVKTFHALA